MLNGGEMDTFRLLADHTRLNEGTDDELRCTGYHDSSGRKCLFYFLCVISLGTLLLVLYWKPELECILKKSKCSLRNADTVLLQDLYGNKFVATVKSLNIADELCEFNDAYNREESRPENVTEVDDVATLTVKQMEPMLHCFDHQHVRYLWDNNQKSYTRLLDLSANTRCEKFHTQYQGLSTLKQRHKRMLYGNNAIDIHVKSYWKLFIEEVLNPFYIFQIFSIVLWSTDQYYVYASCIFLISAISMAISLYETKKQMRTLHDMVSTGVSHITVVRDNGSHDDVLVTDLVPGDVVVIPAHGCVLTCDAVLMAGTCIVNESMLTGESVPVTKTPLHQSEDDEIYSPEQHKRHTLFSGTKVIQTRYYGSHKVLAVVVRTGFSTAKGELVRGILYPKPLGFKFYQDAMKFVGFLFIVACFGMAYTVYMYISFGAPVKRLLLRVLDIITIIVPPALPAAMTVGTVYAQSRLKKRQIFCISPPRINYCGRLNLFCFDKTGTLTEDGLDLGKIIPVKDGCFKHAISDPCQMERNELLVAMTTCHSLTIIDGEISGDPMDVIMFNSTKWTLEEPGRDTSKFDTIMPTVVRPATRDTFLPEEDLGEATQFEVGIVRQFTFSSSLKRMSVITRTLGRSNMDVFCKGAPEIIWRLCDKNTVPDDATEVLHQYAIQGLRVIALAWRALDNKVTWHQAQRLSRDKVECEMTFLGLLVMQNKLKRETKPVMKTLLAANIRPVMVTGDMLATAVSVARNCGMVSSRDRVVMVTAHPPEDGQVSVDYQLAETGYDTSPEQSDFDSEDTPFLTNRQQKVTTSVTIDDGVRTHLAVDGKSFGIIEKNVPELMPKLCVQGTVFARMSPDQKCLLIQKQQELGYSVGMCGDGANDCEALKAAHAGISLSEAEASVAAPFTSAVNNIECVVTLMREGRAALITSFGCFKYMALYSFIQFISVMILYTYGFNLGDWQYLYIDLAITTTIALFMGYTEAYQKLVVRRPEGSLIKPFNILSILLQVFFAAMFQGVGILYLFKQPWYHAEKATTHNEDQTESWLTNMVFVVSAYQYIVVAFVFSKGPPFRRRLYTNIPYLVSLLVLTATTTMFFMVPMKPVLDFFKMEDFQEKSVSFRAWIIAIAAGHLIVACIIEFVVTDVKCFKTCVKKMLGCVRPKKTSSKYKLVEGEIGRTEWPPLGKHDYTIPTAIDLNSTQVQVENIPLSNALVR